MTATMFIVQPLVGLLAIAAFLAFCWLLGWIPRLLLEVEGKATMVPWEQALSGFFIIVAVLIALTLTTVVGSGLLRLLGVG